MRLPLRIAAMVAIVLLVAICFPFYGEIIVVLAFLGLPALAESYGNRRWTIAACLVSAVGLILHFSGFRLYGSALVVRTAPLANTRPLAALQPPNLLRFSNGETVVLRDLYIPASVDLSKLSEDDSPSLNDDRILNLLFALGNQERHLAIDVQIDPVTGHALIQRKLNYWCGNTFFPTFLPPRLPSRKVVDLGQILVSSALALPVAKTASGEKYQRELLECLSRAQDGYLYFLSARIPRHDAEAVALGRSLATPGSMDFVTGAFLLVAAQETETYPDLVDEIRRREAINEREYNEIAQARDGQLGTLLDWMDAAEARKQLLPISFKNDDYESRWQYPTVVFASQGDLQGFDAAIEHLADSSLAPDDKERIESELKSFLRWPEGASGFLEWYRNIRERLKSGRDDDGALAFWVDGGRPFDAAYFASMPKPPATAP